MSQAATLRTFFADSVLVQLGMAAHNNLRRKEKNFPAGDDAATKFLYAMAWQNFEKHPDVLIGRLKSAALTFGDNLARRLISRVRKVFHRPVSVSGSLFRGFPLPDWYF